MLLNLQEFLVLPHFSGSGTPYLDVNSKGIISGLTLNTNIHQLYRAIIEGTCFEARMNMEIMQQSGIYFDSIRCIGGGSKSDLWLQIKADISQKPVLAMGLHEAGCLGAALLAGLGFGVFDSIDEVLNQFISVRRTFLPKEERMEIYDEYYFKYQQLYLRNKPLFSE